MSRFLTVMEAIDLGLLGNHDYQKRDRMRLSKIAKHVYQELNLSVIKSAERKVYQINKRTNSIDLPCNFSQLSSVNLVDDCGLFYPVFRNEALKGDWVDVAAQKDCACEFKCGYQLCNTIKSYEGVVETKTDYTPTGEPISFECVTRRGIDGNFFYEDKQYPQRQYVSGVWVDTILHTERTKLCTVELDHNGCVCDSNTNIDVICNACGITDLNQTCTPLGGNSNTPPNVGDDTWIYWCSTKLDWFSVQCGCHPKGLRMKNCNAIYNISELGNRLIFPPNFGWDKVMIRTYMDEGPNEIKIPMIAVGAFVTGLKYWDARWDDRKQNLKQVYQQDYTKAQWGLLLELNKYRLEEQRMILTPPTFVPSYSIPQRTNNAYYDSQ